MGISRDSRHKHRHTGGRRNIHQKKRKFEMGRPSALCKLGAKRVRPVRCRGGNMKYRALRIDAGNFAWGSENCAKKVRILDVVYNATSNELVRTKTLTKNTVVQIDAQPYKQWYLKKYGVDLGKKVKGGGPATTEKKAATTEKKATTAEKKATATAEKKAAATTATTEKKGGKEKKEAAKGKAKDKEKGKDAEEKEDGEEKQEKKSRHVIFKLKYREAKQKLDPAVEEQFLGGRLLAAIASRPGQCGRCDGYVLEGEELTFYRKKLEKKKKA